MKHVRKFYFINQLNSNIEENICETLGLESNTTKYIEIKADVNELVLIRSDKFVDDEGLEEFINIMGEQTIINSKND